MNKKLNYSIATIVATATILGGLALPAFAQVSAGNGLTITATGGSPVGISADVSVTASSSVKTPKIGTGRLNASTTATVMAKIITRAGIEITNRINALNALEARINAMVKLSSDEKTNLSSSIQAQITAMTTLQSQISADQSSNNTSSLKIDAQSITKAYRIYALILPQGEIAAASDRIMTIAGAMTTLAGDLQTRITSAQNADVNMNASVSALADLNAKIADANTQATAAVNITASLQPDNGSTTLMASNTATLKAARIDIQTAQKDLVTARTDAMTIIAAIKASEKVTATASTTDQ